MILIGYFFLVKDVRELCHRDTLKLYAIHIKLTDLHLCHDSIAVVCIRQVVLALYSKESQGCGIYKLLSRIYTVFCLFCYLTLIMEVSLFINTSQKEFTFTVILQPLFCLIPLVSFLFTNSSINS